MVRHQSKRRAPKHFLHGVFTTDGGVGAKIGYVERYEGGRWRGVVMLRPRTLKFGMWRVGGWFKSRRSAVAATIREALS